nr:hypothetical protein CFP56_13356 [Quercus suber]
MLLYKKEQSYRPLVLRLPTQFHCFRQTLYTLLCPHISSIMRFSIVIALGSLAVAGSDSITLMVRQATSSANGAHIEQTATSLIVPSSTYFTTGQTGLAGCTSGQKTAVLAGLSEAHTALGTTGTYYINSHWNDIATVEYLGSPWYMKQGNRRALVTHAFNKAYGYQQSWFSWSDTQVYCLADNDAACLNEPSYITVTNDHDRDILTLGFCDRYFTLGTLDGIYNEASKGGNPNDLSEYENRARAWITAILRVKWIAGLTPQRIKYPRSPFLRYVESASQAKFLAKLSLADAAPKKTIENPSNLAWYAMAQWVQTKSGDYAHRPQVPDDLADAGVWDADKLAPAHNRYHDVAHEAAPQQSESSENAKIRNMPVLVAVLLCSGPGQAPGLRFVSGVSPAFYSIWGWRQTKLAPGWRFAMCFRSLLKHTTRSHHPFVMHPPEGQLGTKIKYNTSREQQQVSQRCRSTSNGQSQNASTDPHTVSTSTGADTAGSTYLTH